MIYIIDVFLKSLCKVRHCRISYIVITIAVCKWWEWDLMPSNLISEPVFLITALPFYITFSVNLPLLL